MENKYKEDQVVYAKENPDLELIVRRYVSRIYYCKIKEEPARKEVVYFERQLMSETEKAAI